jgi:Domain of Unknown Function (DUF748)
MIAGPIQKPSKPRHSSAAQAPDTPDAPDAAKLNSERDSPAPRRHMTPRRRRRLLVWLGVALVAAALAVVTFGLSALDGPLRAELERKMNQNLHGYRVSLGHAHAALFGLRLNLNDLVVRQDANPEPPVADLPRLHLSVQWLSLLRFHLVGDAFFDRPRIHANLPQLTSEAHDRMSPEKRGWQQALESIFPLKFNSFRVRDGAIVYVDDDAQHPLEITHWDLDANNIRNIDSRDRTYPSPFRSEGKIFETGSFLVAGNADFLAVPFPGVRGTYKLVSVPLDRLAPLGARTNLEIHGGRISTNGEVEYSPRHRSVHVVDVRLDAVRVDYVHTSGTAEAEKRRGEEVAAAAKAAGSSPVRIAIDQIHIVNGNVGFVNHATSPSYRVFVDQASLVVQNLDNRQAQSGAPSSAHLRGRFMGTGSGKVDATFRPQSPADDFAAEVALEDAQLPAVNDVLRAYHMVDVAAGTLSLYSQVTVKGGKVQGYVKPLLRDVRVYDPQKDRAKPLGTKIKEKVMNVAAKVLKNRDTGVVGTRVELSGPVNAPHTSLNQILVGLLHNAFVNALLPGFDQATRQKHGA